MLGSPWQGKQYMLANRRNHPNTGSYVSSTQMLIAMKQVYQGLWYFTICAPRDPLYIHDFPGLQECINLHVYIVFIHRKNKAICKCQKLMLSISVQRCAGTTLFSARSVGPLRELLLVPTERLKPLQTHSILILHSQKKCYDEVESPHP